MAIHDPDVLSNNQQEPLAFKYTAIPGFAQLFYALVFTKTEIGFTFIDADLNVQFQQEWRSEQPFLLKSTLEPGFDLPVGEFRVSMFPDTGARILFLGTANGVFTVYERPCRDSEALLEFSIPTNVPVKILEALRGFSIDTPADMENFSLFISLTTENVASFVTPPKEEAPMQQQQQSGTKKEEELDMTKINDAYLAAAGSLLEKYKIDTPVARFFVEAFTPTFGVKKEDAKEKKKTEKPKDEEEEIVQEGVVPGYYAMRERKLPVRLARRHIPGLFGLMTVFG